MSHEIATSDVGACKEPGGVPYASRSGAVFPYHHLDQVQYTCDSCSTGGGVITCQNEMWSADLPVCTGNQVVGKSVGQRSFAVLVSLDATQWR